MKGSILAQGRDLPTKHKAGPAPLFTDGKETGSHKSLLTLAFGEPSYTYRQIERHKSIALKKNKTFVCMCVGIHMSPPL